MTEQPIPEPSPRPMPRLGRGGRWSAHLDSPLPPTEPHKPAPRPRPTGWAKTGDVGATAQLGADEEPVTVPARPYGVPAVDFSKPGFGIVSVAEARSWGIEPPASELLAMADDLNAHGGLDETFVAELLRQAADPYADAKRQLGIVDPPSTPVKTTKPITYEEIVEALEKIAPLGPQRLDVVKLTQEQIDAVTASQPHAAPSAEPWHFFGTPVGIVETVEESTPYQLSRELDPTSIRYATPFEDSADGALARTRRQLGIVGDIPLTDAEREQLRRSAIVAMADVETVPPYSWAPTAARGHQHIWTTTSPMRCVQCRRYLTPWWRRALDRVRRWTR